MNDFFALLHKREDTYHIFRIQPIIAQWLEPQPSNPVVMGSGPGRADIYVPAILRSR